MNRRNSRIFVDYDALTSAMTLLLREMRRTPTLLPYHTLGSTAIAAAPHTVRGSVLRRHDDDGCRVVLHGAKLWLEVPDKDEDGAETGSKTLYLNWTDRYKFSASDGTPLAGRLYLHMGSKMAMLWDGAQMAPPAPYAATGAEISNVFNNA